jgi:hypothetical protein
MRGSAWPRPKPISELVLNGICPWCSASLDTGWQCNDWACDFDGHAIAIEAATAGETTKIGSTRSAKARAGTASPKPLNQSPRECK